jgi:cyclic-di-GMP-binding protein
VPSFDIVSEVDKQEVRNAVDQVNKEVSTRFDFKGSDARIEQADYVLTVHADTDFQLDQVYDILAQKLAKRGVDVKCLDIGSVEKVSGNKVKRSVTVKTGVETELAKKIVRVIKDSKLKVQASIQGDAYACRAPSATCCRTPSRWCAKSITDFPLQYQNFRD